MEREAIHRSLTYLKNKINVAEITTDSSTAVTKMLGTQWFWIGHIGALSSNS